MTTSASKASGSTLVEQLAAFASEVYCDGSPAEVRTSVRQRILDIVGVSLGASPLETSRAAVDHVSSLGGVEQAQVLGSSLRLPAPNAAFANGVLAHSLDYDDTHLPSILHPSASIVPAALAAAQTSGATGAQTLDAIGVGIEICVRLGMAGFDKEARDSLFFRRGQHATSICGAVAGAATAALLLGATRNQVAHAMGLAASMGSGVIEANRAGGTVKRIHCGVAASSAVNAAMLAIRGFTGPPTIFEGRFGFFQAWIDGKFDSEQLTGGLGERWEVPGIFFKPYPCNHFTQTGIDAAIQARDAGIHTADIASIELAVATSTVRTIGQPIQDKRRPATGYLAKFSGPFTVASALLGGSGLGLGLDDFDDELVNDPERLRLMSKVSVVGSPECDSIYPDQFPAILTITTTDGASLRFAKLNNRGGNADPLTDDELLVKFRDCATRVLSPTDVELIEKACANLEHASDVDDILAPTSNVKER